MHETFDKDAEARTLREAGSLEIARARHAGNLAYYVTECLMKNLVGRYQLTPQQGLDGNQLGANGYTLNHLAKGQGGHIQAALTELENRYFNGSFKQMAIVSPGDTESRIYIYENRGGSIACDSYVFKGTTAELQKVTDSLGIDQAGLTDLSSNLFTVEKFADAVRANVKDSTFVAGVNELVYKIDRILKAEEKLREQISQSLVGVSKAQLDTMAANANSIAQKIAAQYGNGQDAAPSAEAILAVLQETLQKFADRVAAPLSQHTVDTVFAFSALPMYGDLARFGAILTSTTGMAATTATSAVPVVVNASSSWQQQPQAADPTTYTGLFTSSTLSPSSLSNPLPIDNIAPLIPDVTKENATQPASLLKTSETQQAVTEIPVSIMLGPPVQPNIQPIVEGTTKNNIVSQIATQTATASTSFVQGLMQEYGQAAQTKEASQSLSLASNIAAGIRSTKRIINRTDNRTLRQLSLQFVTKQDTLKTGVTTLAQSVRRFVAAGATIGMRISSRFKVATKFIVSMLRNKTSLKTAFAAVKNIGSRVREGAMAYLNRLSSFGRLVKALRRVSIATISARLSNVASKVVRRTALVLGRFALKVGRVLVRFGLNKKNTFRRMHILKRRSLRAKRARAARKAKQAELDAERASMWWEGQFLNAKLLISAELIVKLCTLMAELKFPRQDQERFLRDLQNNQEGLILIKVLSEMLEARGQGEQTLL